MTPLSTCWLLIELFVIPNGFLKWFYLSFYVDPCLLVVCQLYLWIKVLQTFLFTLILLIYRFSCYIIFYYLLRFLKFFVVLFKKFIVPNKTNPIIIEEVDEDQYYEIPNTLNQNEIILYSNLRSTTSYETVHLDMMASTKSDDTIYVYDFQARVAQMFDNHDRKISSFLEPNRDGSMELEELQERHDEVSSEVVEGSHEEEMNIIGECNSTSPTNVTILFDTELELDFLESSSVSSSPASVHQGMNEYVPSLSSSNSSPLDYGMLLNQNLQSLGRYTNVMVMDNRQQLVYKSSAEEEVDFFYKKYAESMSWFDVLNHDRLCAISEVMSNPLSSPNAFELKMESTTLPVQYISWNKVARKRLVKSLESELELVYVAQSCLSWEALHHQYRKIESICSNAQNGVFYGNLAAKFQKFQILLERFVEDDSCGGKRHSNYVHTRFSQNNLLQVPEVSGYVESSNERMINGESNKAIEVLKAIEKCINAFWFYVRADDHGKKKTSWRKNNFLRVEDPRDIGLLHDITRKLQMKELWMKDVKGKRKCWLRKATKPRHEDQCTKIELVCTMIDMKLVSRVLHMSIISTTHLKWCQNKLENIDFKDGQILRTTTSLLFPS